MIRHAVVFRYKNRELPEFPGLPELAYTLLSEWGVARGLIPAHAGVFVQRWDFDRIAGYALPFEGDMLPENSLSPARLRGRGRGDNEVLAGTEERFDLDTVLPEFEYAVNGKLAKDLEVLAAGLRGAVQCQEQLAGLIREIGFLRERVAELEQGTAAALERLHAEDEGAVQEALAFLRAIAPARRTT